MRMYVRRLDDETMITAKGHFGARVTFDGNFVEIRKRGLSVVGGSGYKRIPVTSISAIQIKPAGVFTNGFIQFTISGGNEVRAVWGLQAYHASGDENSVMFTKKHEAEFHEIARAIEQGMLGRYN